MTTTTLRRRLADAINVVKQYENGIIELDEMREKLTAYGVTLTDDQFRAIANDEATPVS